MLTVVMTLMPAPAVALGEHGIGLAAAAGRAQVDAERAYLLDLADPSEPLSLICSMISAASRWSRLLNGSTVADQVLRAADDLPVQVVNVGHSDKTTDEWRRPRHDARQQG
jgi:hypothetical protein